MSTSSDVTLTIDMTDEHIVLIYQLLDIWIELASEDKFDSIKSKSIDAVDKYPKRLTKLPTII